MTVDQPEIERIGRHLWGAAQRMGMRIAEMPLDQRDKGFAICEKAMRDTALEMGLSQEKVEVLIKIQMEAVRGMVLNIDVGGAPQGGRA